MSTNKTEHYHLHQWAGADPVSLPEVNHNFSVLDAAVAEAAVVPYVVGSYVGTSKSGNKISLPFHPSYLIIGRLYGPSSAALDGDAVVAFGSEGFAKVLTIEDDGFTPITYTNHPQLNTSKVTYVYIAFR